MRKLSGPELKKAISALVILLLVVGIVAVWQYALGDRDPAPDAPGLVSSETTQEPEQAQPEAEAEEEGAGKSEADSESPDPDTFSSLVVPQMDLEIFYSKGIPGFSYKILNTPAGTQYIEFNAESLEGTKCTNDQGVFASIIKNPSPSEESTITSTTKIGVDSYGLSLASGTCTEDTALLANYQSAFKSGFGSLKLSED